MPGEVGDLGAVRARRRWPAGSPPPRRAAARRGSARRPGPAGARGAPAPDREAQRGPQAAAGGRRSGTSRLRLSATTPSVVPTPRTSSAGRDRSATSRAPPMPAKSEVGGGHDQARQQRCDRRAGEPAVRLQDAGEHDADAVQHHLRGEDEQEAGGQGAPRRGSRPPSEQLGDRLGAAARAATARAGQHQQRPAQQRRRRPADLLAVPDGDAAGEHRHDEAGQRTAGDHLEDDVRARCWPPGRCRRCCRRRRCW